MYSEKQLVDTSKFLSFVLRHKPEALGLTLDSEGWADINLLITAAMRDGRKLDLELISAVVAGNDKKRFSLSEDGLRIRAAQGHSTKDVAISYASVVPPAVLYHGTASRFLESIHEKGLLPGSRQFVHLSQDVQAAVSVGSRHGKPVVLSVAAADMQARGFAFHQADNGVWLTGPVPAEFLRQMD